MITRFHHWFGWMVLAASTSAAGGSFYSLLALLAAGATALASLAATATARQEGGAVYSLERTGPAPKQPKLAFQPESLLGECRIRCAVSDGVRETWREVEFKVQKAASTGARRPTAVDEPGQ